MKTNIKEWMTKVADCLKELTDATNDLLGKKLIVYDGAYGMKMKMVSRSVTSNSSALINLTDLGAHSSNCSGLNVMCTTSNYRVSTPILWSNGSYYVTLFNWNNATPVANKAVNIIVTWFEA